LQDHVEILGKGWESLGDQALGSETNRLPGSPGSEDL